MASAVKHEPSGICIGERAGRRLRTHSNTFTRLLAGTATSSAVTNFLVDGDEKASTACSVEKPCRSARSVFWSTNEGMLALLSAKVQIEVVKRRRQAGNQGGLTGCEVFERASTEASDERIKGVPRLLWLDRRLRNRRIATVHGACVRRQEEATKTHSTPHRTRRRSRGISGTVSRSKALPRSEPIAKGKAQTCRTEYEPKRPCYRGVQTIVRDGGKRSNGRG